MNTKIIVITGGVYSSLGKGIVCSSIGCILKNAGYKISMLKLDPYLNIDPGTLSPYQHGEVFVTEDGSETDLDLGHYERFTDINLNQNNSVTSGSIYYEVLSDERLGKYNGKTVQVIPHITQKIEDRILKNIKATNPDFLIVEIGGTIGDIESLPFVESLRIMKSKYKDNFLFIHLSPLFKLKANSEIKTKPTQHSIKNLRNLGINPAILILRNESDLHADDIRKLSWTCDISEDNIFVSKDCEHIYEVPKILYEQKIANAIARYFKLKNKKVNMLPWNQFLDTITKPKSKKLKIGIVGKYIELNDSYFSIIESLKISAYYLNIDLIYDLVDSTKITAQNCAKSLKGYDGILVPGGFGNRGIDGMKTVANYCVENDIPYFGICLGMQVLCINQANQKMKLANANSLEFDNTTQDPIFIEIDKSTKKIGSSLRRGNKEVKISQKTLAYSSYKTDNIVERHRHRFCFNNEYIPLFEKNGFVFSGMGSQDNIVEIVELSNKRFIIGVQYHPEFLTRPNKIHPLFKTFLEKSLN